jgi:hypothetical protein
MSDDQRSIYLESAHEADFDLFDEEEEDDTEDEDGFSQRAWENHLADMADTAAEFDDN